MGVPGLWRIVGHCEISQDLAIYALSKSIHRQDTGPSIRPIVVGIDASIWMHECQAAFFKCRHAQMGENPELRTLFYRLANLLKLCLIPVFVFDGVGRPKSKRGQKVSGEAHWITERFIAFIDAFGFHSHYAPGEAEAELAYLNKLGFIDAVLTSDSDVLIFGATTVLMSDTKDKNTVRVYQRNDIYTNPSVSLTDGGLLLLALLNGGDYGPGLPGCGGTIAHGLARSGLGDSLLHASFGMSEKELLKYLQTWREELRKELDTNSSGYLNHRHPLLSRRVSSGFPDVKIIRLYTQPLVSTFDNLGRSIWSSRNANITELASLCNRSFSWDTSVISNKLVSRVWTGVCFRQLLEFESYGKSSIALVKPSSYSTARRLPKSDEFTNDVDLHRYSVRVDISSLTSSIPIYPQNRRSKFSNHENKSAPLSVQMQAPVVLLAHWLPHLTEKRRSTKTRSHAGKPSAVVFNTYSLPTTPVTPGSSIVASATPSVSSAKPVEKIGSLNSFDIFEHYYDDDNDSKHNNSPSSGAESPKITSQATTTFLGIFEISDDEVDTSALPRHCPTNFLGVVEISDTEDEDDFIAEVGRSSSASSAAVSRFIDFTKD